MNQLPAFLQNRQSKSLAATLVANLGTGSPPYVSIADNRFTLIDAGGEEEPVPTYDPKLGPYLDCVIIDVNESKSKIYYDTGFDPKAEGQAPVCWSDNGIGPSKQSSKPQSMTCMQCPQNVWGSKTSQMTGKAVKACNDVQKIALLIPGDDVLFLMRVPPASLKQLGAYVLKFNGQTVDVSDVITRITFESQGILAFNAVNYIDEATFKQREEAVAAKKTDMLVGRGDQPIAQLAAPVEPATLPAPVQQVQQPAVLQQQVAPLAGQQVQESSSAAEPTRRRRRNTAAVEAPQGAQTAPFATLPQPTAAAQMPPQTAPFGIGQPMAANADVTAALDSIFKR